MNDSYIVTAFVVLDDLLKAHAYQEDCRAQSSAAEVLTVAVVAALNPIMGDPDCGGPLGGTFAGPKSNDLGSWGKVTVCVTYDGVKHCASIEIILT